MGVDREPQMPVAVEPEVVEVARRVVQDATAELLDWSATPIAHVGIIDPTGGLLRVAGRVRSHGAELEWSCALKILRRPPLDECLGPRSWCYWRREAAFYASSLPSSLPASTRAPLAYGVDDHDDEAHIWIEYITAPPSQWRPEDFHRAAHAAGLSAGALGSARRRSCGPRQPGGMVLRHRAGRLPRDRTGRVRGIRAGPPDRGL